MSIYSNLIIPTGFYVYAYLREDYTPYYIGKGCKYRAWKKGKHEYRPPVDRTRIVILEGNLTDLGALALERRMIRWYGRKDITYSNGFIGILRNKTDGGEGTGGFKRPPEQCLAISKRLRGVSQSAERRAKQSKALTGLKQSLKSRQKRSASLMGSKRTTKQCENIKNGVNSPEARLKKYLSSIGKKRSDKTRQNMRDAAARPEVQAKNRMAKGPQPIDECSYCGKIGGRSLITRYHNNNCKFKELENE